MSIVFSASAQAITLTEVQQKLAAHSILRGLFTQTKTLQMFNQPLISTGSFLLDQNSGLIWQQLKPFSVSLVLVKDKLSQQFAGQEAEVIEAKDNPMVFYFSHLFLSLFKGDMDGLAAQFTMQLDEKKQGWLLLLKPKVAPLDKVFDNISIEGDTFIQTLRLTELSGDVSEITFSEQKTTPDTLTDDEQRVFEF